MDGYESRLYMIISCCHQCRKDRFMDGLQRIVDRLEQRNSCTEYNWNHCHSMVTWSEFRVPVWSRAEFHLWHWYTLMIFRTGWFLFTLQFFTKEIGRQTSNVSWAHGRLPSRRVCWDHRSMASLRSWQRFGETMMVRVFSFHVGCTLPTRFFSDQSLRQHSNPTQQMSFYRYTLW